MATILLYGDTARHPSMRHEVRFEDLLLITQDGCETLTRYPYDL